MIEAILISLLATIGPAATTLVPPSALAPRGSGVVVPAPADSLNPFQSLVSAVGKGYS